ncbi:hypothetical protein CspHIS471_0403580 [Cutaneotrichosporon sp. HIS471]|nr:hypothetical protein CspHIS471_0403580 [Cutaneotrichosporon sp. HIS471]
MTMRPKGFESPRTPAAMSPPSRSALLDHSPSSPRAHMVQLSTPSRLPSITAQQPFDFDDGSHSHMTVFGFSPPRSHMSLPPSSSPMNSHFYLPKAGAAVPILSPSLGAGEHVLQGPFLPAFEPASPRFTDSPHVLAGEFPPRSRRNSAAVVSISLSSRSRSRTPHGRKATLPAEHSGSGTPSKATTPRANLAEEWSPVAPGLDNMDGGDEDWRAPTGGIMLDADESTDSFSFDDDEHNRSWTAESEVGVTDVLRPGAVFGEGLEFEGDIIKPATGRLDISGSDDGVPLRRDGSKIGVPRQQTDTSKRSYEVIRRLGSGSYAVVYLVRERGRRKREFALKCLSKHDLEEEQLETQLFEATIHLLLPIHPNIVTLHETLQTKNWLFLMLELCPGEDLFYWLERSRDASPPPAHSRLIGGQHLDNGMDIMSSSRLSSSSIPFSSSQLFSGLANSYNSPNAFSPNVGFGSSQFSGSPASLLFAHHNGMPQSMGSPHAATPPTPSLLSSFSANTLLTTRRLRLIASMFSQMCEAVAICHNAGVSHRDIKPENFICCDSVELETVADGDDKPDFGPQAKRKVVVKLTDFGLATTDEDSGDVECGSKPYMAYECRNNLGPSYRPAPADVWSLGIVLINMLFHRNPWKDPTEGDPNLDAYFAHPVGFLQTKFTGIGKEVATYIAEHVLCIKVEDRVSAHELGQWIRNLPEMIGGRRAIHRLKVDRLESRSRAVATDKGLFVKSPITAEPTQKSALASALASSALATSVPISVPRPPPTGPLPPPPVLSSTGILSAAPHYISTIQEVPSLSSLPPHTELVEQPDPTPELEPDEIRSATTVDDNPTPTDMSTVVSPEPTEGGDDVADLGDLDKPEDDGSGQNPKRRKRGVRKGKAAQAALAAKEDPEDKSRREALLAELVTASQDLARDLSVKKPFDPHRIEDFPPLGMDPREAAAGRKSKWKDFLAASKGNPQLEALARRVADRDAGTNGGWSAPAKLQQSKDKDTLSRPNINRQTATATSSVVSANTATSSATSSMGAGADEDDWRRPARERELRDTEKNKEWRPSTSSSRRGATEDSTRHRQATIAAAALANGLDPMGAFGRPSHLRGPSVNRSGSPLAGPPRHRLERDHADRNDGRWAPPTSSVPMPLIGRKDDKAKHVTHEVRDRTDRPWREARPRGEFNPTKSAPAPMGEFHWASSAALGPISIPASSFSNASTPTPTAAKPPLPTQSSTASLATINGNTPTNGAAISPEMPNKPKLKGQISTLSNMLSRLKAKGRD